MNYEKYIKDGLVAVLYSPGFGAGWYTWNTKYEGLVFDKEIVEAVLADNLNLVTEICERKYPDAYLGGARDLTVAWLDEGTLFEIREYDGSESIYEMGEQEYLCA
jgi:hypothetical protein